VRDVAEGHLLAALSGRSRRRYILGGTNIGHREFAYLVSEVAGITAPRLVVPPGVLKRMGSAAEWLADHVTHKHPLMTRRSVAYVAGRWRWYSTARAERELGYKPRPIHDAVAAAVGWFRGRA
jgi:dihydroflavonol-4-reductase